VISKAAAACTSAGELTSNWCSGVGFLLLQEIPNKKMGIKIKTGHKDRFNGMVVGVLPLLIYGKKPGNESG
jgi:hypothetical protein